MSPDYSLHELCAALGVTGSGYHAWVRRAPGLRAQANANLLPLIAQAHQESRQTYGSPRILNWLRQRGQRCGRVRVARLMQQAGLSSRPRRRFRPVSLTDSNHGLPIAPNHLLHRQPTVKPDAVWVADITYVPTAEGWLHVAGLLDRCTRRCIGWAMGDTLATTLPLAALDMALQHRRPPAGTGASLRPRRAICQRCLSATAGPGGRHSQHEPTGQLLRQRHDGKLLEHLETGADSSFYVRHAGRSPRRHL